MYSQIDDLEAGLEKSNEFAEQTIRLGFIRKVFGLLTVQLLVTLGEVALFTFCKPVNTFAAQNPWLFWVAFGIGFVTILCLACSESARRTHPWNIFFLFLFTVAEGFLLGVITSQVQTQVVLLALGITSVVVFSITLYAFQTKYDFTTAGGTLFTLFMCLFAAGIMQLFIHAPWLHIAISLGGAALFSVYLVFDIQLLMGGIGAHKYSISPDEYVFAALNIYLDVINLFLYILQFVNEVTNR